MRYTIVRDRKFEIQIPHTRAFVCVTTSALCLFAQVLLPCRLFYSDSLERATNRFSVDSCEENFALKFDTRVFRPTVLLRPKRGRLSPSDTYIGNVEARPRPDAGRTQAGGACRVGRARKARHNSSGRARASSPVSHIAGLPLTPDRRHYSGSAAAPKVTRIHKHAQHTMAPLVRLSRRRAMLGKRGRERLIWGVISLVLVFNRQQHKNIAMS